MRLYCEICRQAIAEFDPKEISIPISNEMFKPLDEYRGAFVPFDGQPTYDLFLCPYCRFSPFGIGDQGQKHPARLMIGADLWFDIPVDEKTEPAKRGPGRPRKE